MGEYHPPYRAPELYDFKSKKKALQHYVFQMLNRTQKLFKYENLPETIPQGFLEEFLQMNGNCVIFKHEENLYAATGGLAGFPNVYYFAKDYIISNPALNISKQMKIGTECVLIRNDWYMEGLLPICERYASLLVENDITLRMITINSRKANVFMTHTDAQRESVERFEKRVADGEEAVAISEGLATQIRVNPYAEIDSQITKFIEFQQYVKGNFYNELGLQASFNMKREALSQHEISANDGNLVPLIDQMLEERKKGIDEVNKLYGTNITVDFDSAWKHQIEKRELELELVEAEVKEIEEPKDTVSSSKQESDEDDTDNNS